MKLKVHEMAAIFQEMDESEYTQLRDSIKEIGQIEPIVLLDGKILDGRNRYRACLELNIEPKLKNVSSKVDPISYVLARNLYRRHLDESQRAMIGGRVATLRHGGARKPNISKDFQDANSRISETAKKLNVGGRGLNCARAVLERGCAPLVNAVDKGEIKVSQAADIAEMGERRQLEALSNKDIRTAVAQEGKRKRKQRRASKKESPVDAQEDSFALKAVASELKYITLSSWKTCKEREIIDADGGKDGMNEQKTLDIEWARWSWNPVTGCEHNCPYCYAREIAERRGGDYKFEPTIHPARLSAARAKKVPESAKVDISYKNIFTCSMADLFGKWVPKEWIGRVLGEVAINTQWNFLCLTKFPQRAIEFDLPDNFWMGTTVDAQSRVKNAEKAFENVQSKTKWLSCEPLLTPLKFNNLEIFDWIVVGGASRTASTPAWIPPLDWITDLHQQARDAGLAIYYKTNIGIPDDLRIREFPWQKKSTKILPKEFKYLAGM